MACILRMYFRAWIRTQRWWTRTSAKETLADNISVAEWSRRPVFPSSKLLWLTCTSTKLSIKRSAHLLPSAEVKAAHPLLSHKTREKASYPHDLFFTPHTIYQLHSTLPKMTQEQLNGWQMNIPLESYTCLFSTSEPLSMIRLGATCIFIMRSLFGVKENRNQSERIWHSHREIVIFPCSAVKHTTWKKSKMY